MNYKKINELIANANRVVIIQGENPDADSLASSLALESLLANLNKEVIMFCQIDIPTYLSYIKGADRVVDDFPKNVDLCIVVDTASSDLLIKTQELPEAKQLFKKPVIVIDHHLSDSTLKFEYTELINQDAASTSVIVYELAKHNKWPIDTDTAEYMVQSIMGDTQGLSNGSTNVGAVETVAELMKLGVNISELEDRRRKMMKKSQEILDYKGRLINRISYHLDGQLAVITIPWEEIEEYSHQYNPSMLVMDEMRMVEGVKIAVAYKTYPDGKILGKIRSNQDAPIAEKLAKNFDGGGHPNASGFKLFGRPIDEVRSEVISETNRLLSEL